MYYNIFKSVATECNIDLYMSEAYSMFAQIQNQTTASVAVFPIVEKPVKFTDNYQYNELEIDMLFLTPITQQEFLDADNVTFVKYSELMASKCKEFLLKLKQYTHSGVPIFNTGKEWTIKITHYTSTKPLNEYLTGVQCKLILQCYNLDAVC
jgi:hypothetical protein